MASCVPGIFAGFVEIGTSDFDTLCQAVNEDEPSLNFSVEPIDYYLKRLPNKKNVRKINCAISNVDGETDIFYIRDEDCKRYNLANGLRGCNTIGKPHPGAMFLLNRLGRPELMYHEKVQVMNINKFLSENNIIGIKHLKLDTEGHDCVILNELFDHGTVLPLSITFESNSLTSADTLAAMRKKLVHKGYTIGMVGEDTYAQLAPHLNHIPQIPKPAETTFVSTLFNVCDRIDYAARVVALDNKTDIDSELERSSSLMSLDQPVVFFCDLGYGEKILKKRSRFLNKTVVIEKNLENYDFQKSLESFKSIQLQLLDEAKKSNYFDSKYLALVNITMKTEGVLICPIICAKK